MARFQRIRRPERQVALARVATALAVTSMGALALGALAVGALAIGALVIRTARVHRLEIDELVVAGRHFSRSPSGSAEPWPSI
jgi:hypothetical protein